MSILFLDQSEDNNFSSACSTCCHAITFGMSINLEIPYKGNELVTCPHVIDIMRDRMQNEKTKAHTISSV